MASASAAAAGESQEREREREALCFHRAEEERQKSAANERIIKYRTETESVSKNRVIMKTTCYFSHALISIKGLYAFVTEIACHAFNIFRLCVHIYAHKRHFFFQIDYNLVRPNYKLHVAGNFS